MLSDTRAAAWRTHTSEQQNLHVSLQTQELRTPSTNSTHVGEVHPHRAREREREPVNCGAFGGKLSNAAQKGVSQNVLPKKHAAPVPLGAKLAFSLPAELKPAILCRRPSLTAGLEDGAASSANLRADAARDLREVATTPQGLLAAAVVT